jgi:hypothetical protein
MDYILNEELEYNGKTHMAGSIVNDIPKKSVKWLLEQGLIMKATALAKKQIKEEEE